MNNKGRTFLVKAIIGGRLKSQKPSDLLDFTVWHTQFTVVFDNSWEYRQPYILPLYISIMFDILTDDIFQIQRKKNTFLHIWHWNWKLKYWLLKCHLASTIFICIYLHLNALCWLGHVFLFLFQLPRLHN